MLRSTLKQCHETTGLYLAERGSDGITSSFLMDANLFIACLCLPQGASNSQTFLQVEPPVIAGENLSIYIPWPFPPVWGVADNTKETTKQW